MFNKYVTRYQDSDISLVPNDFGLLIVKVSKYIPFCCLLLAQSLINQLFPLSRHAAYSA